MNEGIGKWLVTFKDGRLGRSSNGPLGPFCVNAGHPDDVAAAIFKVARPRLASSSVDVAIDFEKLTGMVVVGGWRPVGEFTLEAAP
jgi:hypothetical protein